MGIRTCMYCGRDLKDGESCTCPQSVHARQSAQNTTDQQAHASSSWADSNTYRAEKEPTKKHKEKKHRFKQPNRTYTGQSRNFFKQFLSLAGSFFRSPVYTVSNPGNISNTLSIVLIALQGFILSIVAYLSVGNIGRGLFRIAANVIGIRGITGWRHIIDMLAVAVGGTILYTAGYFILSGIFYLIGRWLFKKSTSFWDIACRIAVCGIPMIGIGLFGIIFSLFSLPTLIILIVCGFIMEAILLYEALKGAWDDSSDKAIYSTAAGLFLYLCIFYNIFRLFIH